MDDADFEALRLGYNRSNKKIKTFKSIKSADINGYLGPWGSISSLNEKTPCGPSEVILAALFSFETFFRWNFLLIQEDLRIKLNILKTQLSSQVMKEAFSINSKKKTILAEVICISPWI